MLICLFIAAVPVLAQDDAEGGDDAAATEDTKAYPYPAANTEEYKDFVPKRRHDQQDKFIDGNYNFPAKPRDKWELGINGGLLMVSGDVKARPGWAVGGHIRKSFGYVFSLRGQFTFGSTTGQNWQGTQGWARSSLNDNHIPNISLSGSDIYDDINGGPGTTPDYVDVNNELIFYNYKTTLGDLSLSGVVNIHNIRFHKRETKMNLYGYAGVGGFGYRTMMDQLDADGNEYATLYADVATGSSGTYYENRAERLEALRAGMDGVYESQAERHFDDFVPGFLGENVSYKPTAHVGVGVSFKLTRAINLALDTRVTYTNDDLLDGQRWQEWGALTRDYDTFNYTSLGLNVNLGAKNSVEPLWWMNPLDYSYEEIANECCDDMELPDLEDDDNDGVPNAWDKEPDSREDCPVDTHGRMLDSDRDGILDCDDECPHTNPYDIFGNKVEVGEDGCSPPVEFSCTTIPNLCNCCKPEPKVYIPAPPPPAPVDPCAGVVMPNILFDLNRFGVKSEFAGQLQSIANAIKSRPGTQFCVIGHTDVRSNSAYNDVLSWKRANEVISKLVAEYGIPRSQLTLMYQGESSPTVGGLSDSPMQKSIDADHALNRRVEIRCNCGGSYGGEMSRPAGPDAGRYSPSPRP